MEPHVGRPLAPGRLLGGDQTRSHVGLPLHRVGVVVVGAGCAYIDEDRVVLGRPAPPRLGAVVVGPDQLVQEGVPTEDLVQQQLAVMSLAVVDVEVQRSVRGQQLPATGQSRLQEGQVVRELVVIAEALQQTGAVPAPTKADPRCRAWCVVPRDRQRRARLGPAGVERGVHVDEVEVTLRQGLQDREVVALYDQVIAQLDRPVQALELHDLDATVTAGSDAPLSTGS